VAADGGTLKMGVLEYGERRDRPVKAGFREAYVSGSADQEISGDAGGSGNGGLLSGFERCLLYHHKVRPGTGRNDVCDIRLEVLLQ